MIGHIGRKINPFELFSIYCSIKSTVYIRSNAIKSPVFSVKRILHPYLTFSTILSQLDVVKRFEYAIISVCFRIRPDNVQGVNMPRRLCIQVRNYIFTRLYILVSDHMLI